MTRLTSDDLNQGPKDLTAYDERLKTVTGINLLELALRTAAITPSHYQYKVLSLTSVAVVPITVGQGVLPGFAEKVAEVGRYLGLPCGVTNAKDVAGVREAVTSGSEMIVLADDDTFLALNLISRRVIDNSIATGEIYAAALAAAAKGVSGRYVGVLGLGPVGQAAAVWLDSHDAMVIVHDKNQTKQFNFLSGRGKMIGAKQVEEILDRTNLILDATNESNIIKARELRGSLILSAPGIPLGIDDPNAPMVQVIHDPLQLGVAAMMVQALL